MLSRTRLVLFDAMHTLIRPRLSIGKQYASAFNAFNLGEYDENLVEVSFQKALSDIQNEFPSYNGGRDAWWENVIRRTAIGSGARVDRVNSVLPDLKEHLDGAYRSPQAYEAYDDVMPTLSTLSEMDVTLGIVTNGDSRIRQALVDLGLFNAMSFMLISEEEGVEKPSREIFRRAVERGGSKTEETLHVGDSLTRDYQGAKDAGLNALLLERPEESQGTAPQVAESIPTLLDVTRWIADRAKA